MCPEGGLKVSGIISAKEPSNVSFCTAESGMTNLKRERGGKTEYLHSQTDPVSEAKTWFGSLHLRNVQVIYIYGIGLGYGYDAAKEWLFQKNDRFLVFIEEDPQVVRCFLETERCHDLLNDGHSFLFLAEDKGKSISQFNKIVQLFADKKILLTGLDSETKSNPQKYMEYWSKISFMNSVHSQWRAESHTHGVVYFRNCFLNYLDLANSFLGNKLFGKFTALKGVPAIICGAGPSLDKNIEMISQLSNRALIFAGGTALNALSAKNILPHFGIGIDPNVTHFNRLVMNEAYEIPFFYRMRMLHEALEMVHGDKLYITGGAGYAITEWMEDKLGITKELGSNQPELSEGFNVLNFSLALARALGCNPIICVGIDLAYSPERASYAGGIPSHPIHGRKEDFRTRNLSEEVVIKNNIYGQPVYTLWKWIGESSWYTQYALRHPEIKIINATEGGIGFNSIDNMTLADVVKTYMTKEYDLAALVHCEIQQSRFEENVSREEVKKLFLMLKKSLVVCCNKLHALVDLYTKESERQEKDVPTLEGEIKQNLEDLQQEDAYKAILQKLEEGHQIHIALPLKQLELTEGISEDEMRRGRALIQSAYYRLFSDSAIINSALIDQTLRYAEMVPHDDIEKEKSKSLLMLNDHVPKEFKADPDSQKECLIYPSGQLKWQGFYRNGVLHGPSTFYSEDGTVLASTLFVEGDRQGDARTYYPSGALHSIQPFSRGLRHGDQHYFYPDGLTKSLIHYQYGKLHGNTLLYYPNGKPFRFLGFVHGKREGMELIWGRNGILFIEAHYLAGKPVGRARSWHPHGVLSKEVFYDDRSQRLEEFNWDLEGNPIVMEEEAKGDFFDQVNVQTKKLTESLDDAVDKIALMAPSFAQMVLRTVAPAQGAQAATADVGLIAQVEALQKEMERLKALESIIVSQLKSDDAAFVEDLWKNPQTQQSIEHSLEMITERVDTDMKSIKEGISKIITDIKKKDK